MRRQAGKRPLTWVRVMSAAPLAAAVAPATAIPTLAFFSAGASFTPSPAPSRDSLQRCCHLDSQGCEEAALLAFGRRAPAVVTCLLQLHARLYC
jgi:hypothetical protein